MKRKTIFLSILLATIMMLAVFSPTVLTKDIKLNQTNNDDILVEVNQYNGKTNNPILSEVSSQEAEEIKELLIQLNSAIEENDEETISSCEKILNEKGIFGKNYHKFYSKEEFLEMMDVTRYSRLSKYLDDDDISNYMCYFNAIGQGTMLFTMGIKVLEAIIRIVENASNPLAGLILLIALLPFYVLVFLLTHLIPFRIMMPIGIVSVESGTISSLGAMGSKKLVVDTEPVNVNISGFTGITINIGTENAFLFVSGFAVEVAESDI